MTAASTIQRVRINILKKKRIPLWERFEENPGETHLAAELKMIDDLIVECFQKIDQCHDEIAGSQRAAGVGRF